MKHRAVVSPYLNSVPPDLVDTCLEKALSSDETLSVGQEVAKRKIAMAYDFLAKRYLILTVPELEQLSLIQRTPERVAELPEEVFDHYWSREVLVDPDAIARRHAFESAEIEINRHCNLRCVFCPVSEAPKPRAFMSDEKFCTILDRAAEYGGITQVSLSHYNEPTLTPNLVDRIGWAKERGLRVRLHSNATLFDEAKIEQLAALGNATLWVNLPSVDEAEYTRVTGSKMFRRVMQNLEWLHEYGVQTNLSINAPRDSRDDIVASINERFARMFGESVSWTTDSRAGLIDGAYVQKAQHLGRLNGCMMQFSQVCISHEAKVFVCSQDFNQNEVMGDLETSSLREIAEGDAYSSFRKRLLGLAPAEPGFLCTRCEWTDSRSNNQTMTFGSAYKWWRSQSIDVKKRRVREESHPYVLASLYQRSDRPAPIEPSRKVWNHDSASA